MSANQVKRTTGRKLQAQRAALFGREPLCRECAKHGFTTRAVKRDHIVPLTEGGTDSDDNIQPLCDPCHDIKSEHERQRGIAARAGALPTVRPAPRATTQGGVQNSPRPQPETDPRSQIFLVGSCGRGGYPPRRRQSERRGVMGARGPKPLPSNVHMLRGNPSKKPSHELLDGFQPQVEIPDCPPHLLPEARKEWRRITPELERYGLISKIDRAALALYCAGLGALGVG